MVESSQYFGAVVKCLDELRVETGGVYERVWETMRLEGPSGQEGCDLSKRVTALVEQMAGSVRERQ